ncbi:hypothetical protein ACF0H5_015739 [Mactra antiquata]
MASNCMELNEIPLTGDCLCSKRRKRSTGGKSTAHRTGRYNHNSTRPIIARFRDFPDVELIMSKVSKLNGTGLSIDWDYPMEIRMARKDLWPQFHSLRSKNPGSRVKIVYPAKLICDNNVVRDELSDLFKHLILSRLEHCEAITVFLA